MSFILDALRKSEHARQRQSGPALVDSPVVAPPTKTNRWATAAILLLLVNLVAIGLLLLGKSREEPAATVPVASPPSGAPAPTAAAGPAPSQSPSAQATVTRTLPPPETRAVPPPQLGPESEPPLRGTRNPLEEEMSSASPPPAPLAAAAEPPPGPAAVRPVRPGSVVYQSLPEADPAAAYLPPSASARGNLPSADEMSARGVVPPLRLELHVWSSQPQERFVFVNGHRYREGDATAEGAKIEEITRDGVVMNSGGNRFLLGRN